MRMMKKIALLCFLFVVVLFANNASATLTSSYYDGTTYYDLPWEDGYLRGHIDFAVYDDRQEYEFVTGFDAPGSYEYVYAYQIFNDDLFSDEAVAYFAVLGVEVGITSGIGCEDDLTNGIGPTPTDGYFDDVELKVVWEFKDGVVYKDEHSWLLVFSSTEDWVPGEYEIEGPKADDFPTPVPEPTTLVLLGISSAWLLNKNRKRRKSVN